MFDPVSIAAIVKAAKSLSELRGHFISEEKRSVIRFIGFCENVHKIIQLASDELKKDHPDALDAIGAQLGAWANADTFVDPELKEQRDILSKSITMLSDEMTKLYTGSLSVEARTGMQRQLNLLSGQLKGLADVLRFDNGLVDGSEIINRKRSSGWTKWVKMAVVSTTGLLASTTIGSAAEYIKDVGKRAVEKAAGISPEDDDNTPDP